MKLSNPFLLRNPTSRHLGILFSIGLTLILVIFSVLIAWAFNIQIPLIFILILAFLTAICAYTFFQLIVNFFIYRKIKLIYKNIHQLKTSKGALREKVAQNDDIISMVKKDVDEWTVTYEKDLEDLRLQEEFRREFISNVSHELKTPIFSLQGYLHTLMDGAVEDPTYAKDFLQKALKNCDRLEAIVEDLLHISKYENGIVQPQMEAFDVHKLCNEIIDSLSSLAKEVNTAFHYKEGCNQSFLVHADRDMIRDVLENLMSNAIKYGRANTDIVIGFYDMGDLLLVEVVDHGMGIAKEHLSRVFERFYRVDKHRSRDKGGTGLGLSICKHIIEAHNQSIHVRSKLGVGTTFGFTLKKEKS